VKRVFYAVCSGLILMLVAVAVLLNVNMSKTVAASEIKTVLELAAPRQVDQLARAKYRADQTAKQEAARAQATKIAASGSASGSAVRSPKTTKPTQTASTCNRLIISKIGLNACLATVGLTASGAVDVHANLPAWFNQSSWVGTNSGKYTATFIDGHRSGIFQNLGQLVVGDNITVTLASGESYIYTVHATEIASLNQVDMAKVLSIYGGAGQGLNLMTCDGAYNAGLGTAERRLIIYATR